MSRGDRNKRYALIASGMALLAVVLTSWFSQPISKNIDSASANYIQQQQNEELDNASEANQEIKIFGDTYPQWIMAFFSVAATGISFLAVVWVKRTFLETRRIGQAQVRAYPYFDDVKAMGGTGDENPVIRSKQTGIRFIIRMMNSGASPALTPKLHTMVRYYPIEEFQAQDSGTWITHQMGDISPQSGATIFFISVFPLGIIPRARNGELEIELSLRFEFSDVFDDKRLIQASYYIIGPDFNVPMPSTPHVHRRPQAENLTKPF